MGLMFGNISGSLGETSGLLLLLGGVFLSLRFLGSPVGIAKWIPWLIALALSALIPRAFYRALVPARCPNCAAVRAYLVGTHPWSYACRACEHVHATSMSDGGGPSMHGDVDAEDDAMDERPDDKRERVERVVRERD